MAAEKPLAADPAFEALMVTAADAGRMIQAALGAAPEEMKPDLARLGRVVEYVAVKLQAADSQLTHSSTPGQVSGVLGQIRDQIEDSPAAAAELANRLLELAVYVGPAGGLDELASRVSARVSASATRFATRASQLEGRVESSATMLDQRAGQAVRQVAEAADAAQVNLRAELDGVLSDVQAARDAIEQQRLEAVAAAEALREEIEAASAEHDAAFAKGQELRDVQWSELLARHDERVKSASETVQSRLEMLVQEVEARKVAVDEVAARVDAVAGAAAAAVTGAHYEAEAARERRQAKIWRYVTAAALGLALVPPILVVTAGSPSVIEVVSKLVISGVLAALAGYTATQSAVHRRREHRAQTTALDLLAFDPFVAPLSSDQREIERVIFTRRTFGRPDDGEADIEDAGLLLRAVSFLRRARTPDASEPPPP
ncbi:MAG: hypothetical protein R3C15_15590 [Thermoleophilia bacterium]